MDSMHALIPVTAILLLHVIWMVNRLDNREETVSWNIFKQRANGVDVSSFKVVCVGLKVRSDKIVQRELAVMKNFMADEWKAMMLINGTTTYQDGEI